MCKKLGTIHSKGNDFSCSCGLRATYTETGFLEGENLPFSTITDWDRWQVKELALIVNNAGDEKICIDDCQRLFKVQVLSGDDPRSFHNRGSSSRRFTATPAGCGTGSIQISRTELHCAGMVFPLQEITRFAIVDTMTLTFAMKDGSMYEILSDIPRSALKYLEIFNMLQNISE